MEPQPQIKLIALDMDGTLLRDDHTVSEENRRAIKDAQERGITVMISTGRPLINCREIVESLDLATYLITVNGSEIWDENLQLLDRTMIDSRHIEHMWGLAQRHNTYYWSSTVGAVWNSSTTFPERISDYDWLKFGFNIPDEQIRRQVWDELESNSELSVTNSSPTNIEVNAAGVNKAAAIQKVCDRLSISMDNVLAVGDSLNDLEMIRHAGVGVAMGNAQDIVKKEADWVTATNEAHGVAVAIQKWT